MMMRTMIRVLAVILGCAIFAGVAFGKSPTTVSVTSSLNPSVYGTSVTLTATIAPSTANGRVTFADESGTLGTVTSSGGMANYSTSTFPAGAHSITATYAGNASYSGSTSPVLTQTVNQATPTVTLVSSSNPSTYGSSVGFSATVSPAIATGTVTFTDGSTAPPTTLGTGTVTGGTAICLNPSSACSTSPLTAGSHSITATYSGDANDSSSSSSALAETVNKASVTVTLTSSGSPSTYGSPLTFTATVTPSFATGTVTFAEQTGGCHGNSCELPREVPLATDPLTGNTAILTTSGLPVGSYSIVAVYNGDSNDYTGTSRVLPQTISPDFVATNGQMAVSRSGQAATQLANGQVLVTGGMSSSGVTSSADLYTLTGQTFAPTAALNVARWLHTSTLLNDGTVLIAGGSDLANEETLDTAEIYNPTAGTFTLLTNTLNTARVGHTATLLQNGQVLIVGGYDPQYGLIADAELYDPPTQSFIDLGDTNAPRYEHTATMLQNGQVLIAGGEVDPTPSAAFDTAELFNLASQTFTPVSVPMTSPREGHAAVLLNNGQVIITGGDVPGAGSLNTAEVYDPPSDTFIAITSTMTVARIWQVATLLNGGNVLLAGGATDSSGGNSTPLNSAEVYNPASQTFTATSNMTTVREHQTATVLNDGTVLEAGGTNGTTIFNSAELYMPSQLSGLASIAITPMSPSLGTGAQQLFSAVGTFGNGSTASLASVLWTSSNTSIAAISNDASDPGFASGLTQGSATVTASAGGISGTTTLTVTGPTLVSIQLSPQSPTIALGSTQQFTATGVYTDGSTQDLTSSVTWSSSATVVASINSSGLAAGLFQGVATIQVSFGAASTTTNLSVTSPALVSIAVNPGSATIALGASQQYQATGTYSDGSTQNVTTLVAWSSAAPTIASISPAGLAVGSSQGSTTVSASFESISASVPVTVGTPSLVSIVVAPSAGSLSTGATQQLTATGNYTDGSTQNLTSSTSWASSNPAVLGVSATGLATATSSTGEVTITATSGTVSGTAVLIVTQGTTQANLNTSRYLHSATMLETGQILVAGGINCTSAGSCTYLASAEIYSPNSSNFTNTGALAQARSAPSVLLNNGNVLIAGGYFCDSSGNCSSQSSAELYTPAATPGTGTFSTAGTMTVARSGQTMTLLSDGTVLIAGGQTCTSATSCTTLSSAEIYNPVAGTFTTVNSSMTAARFGASAVALNSGLVLIAGGFDGTNLPAAAEIYSLTQAGFTGNGPSLNTPRFNATATLLNDGQVLVAGGSTCGSVGAPPYLPGCPSNAGEIYDPVANTFTSVSNGMHVARFSHTATLLNNGQVAIVGGFSSCSSSCTSEASTEFFDPVAQTFSSGQTLSNALAGQTAMLTANGNALLIGGINSGVTLTGDEWYQPTSLTPLGLVSISITPANLFLAPGQTQQLIASGTFNDGSTQTLQSVFWNSSNPSAALVSNSPGNAGTVNAQATGATTITATAGDVGASATLNVAALVSLVITPANPSIAINSSQQLTATATFSDGSTQNVTASVTWSSSNSSAVAVSVSSASGLPGFATGLAAGSATITATLGSVSVNVLITVPASLPPPSISSVYPPVGQAGTPVTISGSGFGTTQGTGTVWLGTTYGVVDSWTDAQIIATVASISQSGTAQVQQNGLSSNTMPFNVSTATILNVSPSSGVPGAQVTINGSGFGAEQGSGQLFLGTANGVVQSWSDTQIVAEVAFGAQSGWARILQNGVMSNAVPFTINLPQIVGVSPNSGTAGATVTITGSSFGGGTNCRGSGPPPDVTTADPANSYLLIGGAAASVTTWCNTKIVATVPATAVTGVVKVNADGVWSNAVIFTVIPNGPPVTLNPNLFSMVIGEARTLQAVNANGQPMTGLTWTSSNTAIAKLSTDDPPVITAVGAGSATIIAGNASADVTVYMTTLPLGTVVWSNPGDGSVVDSIVPAVPSATGLADVFVLNSDCNVQAIASDGTVAWTANIGQLPQGSLVLRGAYCNEFVPDFQGGIVVMSAFVEQVEGNYTLTPVGFSLQKFDGITGQPYPAYTLNNDGTQYYPGFWWSGIGSSNGNVVWPSFPPFVVHPNGTIFTLDGSTYGVAVVDPLTGQNKTINYEGNSWATPCTYAPSFNPDACQGSFGNWIVAGDGYAYIPYAAAEVNGGPFGLLRLDTDGNMSTINLTPFGTNTSLITNADQGVLLSWQTNWTSTSQTYNVATTAATNVTSQTTTNYLVQPVLQAQDETFYGTFSTSSGTNMIKFGPSGNVQWSVPDTPQIATADGGVIGASGITYDSNGNASGETSLPTYSWTGAAYTDGPVNQIVAMYPNTATSFWAGGDANLPPGANASGTNTAYQSIEQTLYMRIFAPFYAFGPDPLANTGGYTPVVNPCLQYCFLGDNRSFTTKVDRGVVTSRINGFVTLRSPGVAPIDPKVYSDLTTAIYRTPPNNTGKSNSTIDMLGPRTGNHLQMHLRGADPLVPLAPNIDMNLFITSSVTNGQVCYSGNLIGDAFPDTEVFVVNSEGQATTLMTYATTDGPNSGPWTLWNPIPLSLGSFSNVCVPK